MTDIVNLDTNARYKIGDFVVKLSKSGRLNISSPDTALQVSPQAANYIVLTAKDNDW